MKKMALFTVLAMAVLSGCASNSGNYNSYDNRSTNEKQMDNAISSEMNSLSSADIAQLNKLK